MGAVWGKRSFEILLNIKSWKGKLAAENQREEIEEKKSLKSPY